MYRPRHGQGRARRPGGCAAPAPSRRLTAAVARPGPANAGGDARRRRAGLGERPGPMRRLVVIGAGLAGLVAAYELKRQATTSRCSRPDPATERGVLVASCTWGQDALQWGVMDEETRLEEALDDVAHIRAGIRDVYETGASHAWYSDRWRAVRSPSSRPSNRPSCSRRSCPCARTINGAANGSAQGLGRRRGWPQAGSACHLLVRGAHVTCEAALPGQVLFC